MNHDPNLLDIDDSQTTAAAFALSQLHSCDTQPSTALPKRALPLNAPYGYEPQIDPCPREPPVIRAATNLSTQETEWLANRRKAISEPIRALLNRFGIEGLDIDGYLDRNQDNVPVIGIAISGGGYRAMLNGAGVIQAFDDRTDGSTGTGQLGGLLQSSTYLAGLSGGSWLVGSLYTNNFTSVSDILDFSEDGSSLWQFGNSIFEGPDSASIQLLDTAGYYASIVGAVRAKRHAGFETTLTDYWGRALSYQLVNATDGGSDYTFSSINKQTWFQNGETPLPFIVADGRAPDQTIISANTTVFTINPWELGSHDPTIFGFAPLEYLGTEFDAGRPKDGERCVTGFDNAGFIMGTSSSLFNEGLLLTKGENKSHGFVELIKDAVEDALESVSDSNNDIAYVPNPFYKYNEHSNQGAAASHLSLVDGGEDAQNIPFNPLIQPARRVDVIFAVDSSADTNSTWPTPNSSSHWPSGAAIEATYRRSFSGIQNGTSFPKIPTTKTFVNLGLNNRPTFFGCNTSEFHHDAPFPPLIVYLPNAPYVYNSNVSTFDPSYDQEERNSLVANGFNLATQGNSTLDERWPACVGCAILSRSFERTGTALPDVCGACFDQYCWDGTTDEKELRDYAPSMKLQRITVENGGARATGSQTLLLALAVALSSLFLC